MPQKVVDGKGKVVSVILSIREYKKMLKNSEELESIKAYDEAEGSTDLVGEIYAI